MDLNQISCSYKWPAMKNIVKCKFCKNEIIKLTITALRGDDVIMVMESVYGTVDVKLCHCKFVFLWDIVTAKLHMQKPTVLTSRCIYRRTVMKW